MLERCQTLAPRHRFHFRNPLVSIDSTVIELSVESFPWARYAKARGALKLHYGLDHRGNLPNFLVATSRHVADIRLARTHFPIIPDSIYCFDRGYLDGAWLRHIHDEKAFFVTRTKSSMKCGRISDRPLPEDMRILSDQNVAALGFCGLLGQPLRLVTYVDRETGKLYEFLTNNFVLPAVTIAEIYRSRWQIEVFFKWIKQNLRVKAFLGTSKNAVLTQIWVAMCYYLLLAYIKFQSRYANSLFYLHRLIRGSILDRLAIMDLLSLSEKALARIRDPELDPQLALGF